MVITTDAQRTLERRDLRLQHRLERLQHSQQGRMLHLGRDNGCAWTLAVNAVAQLAAVRHARVCLLLDEAAQPHAAVDANEAAIGRRLELGALAGMAFLRAERDAPTSFLGCPVSLVLRAAHAAAASAGAARLFQDHSCECC
jgi:hypothetical protein